MLALLFALAVTPEPTAPHWITRPVATSDDYPMIARHLSLGGKAVVECNIDENGAPTNCVAISSQPADLGFDQVALNVVQRGRLTPPDTTSVETPPRFRVSVPFSVRPLHPNPTQDWPTPSADQIAVGRNFAERTIRPRPSYAVRLRQTWRLDRLPQEQQDAIIAWLEEMSPSRTQDIEQTTQGVARLLAKYDLQSLPVTPAAEPEGWRRDFQNAALGHIAPMMAEISRRYCATFTCVAPEED